VLGPEWWVKAQTESVVSFDVLVMRLDPPYPLRCNSGQSMTHLDITAPAAPAGAGAVATGRTPVRFLGHPRAYWRILIRGNALMLVTLGIYRFWLNTDMRRFLWSNTEVAGHGLEYTGTARELLIGFLIALAILLPVNALLFLIALAIPTMATLTTPLTFLFLALLGHYAVFRARRYRLTRTVLRGVRFYQTGSAIRYAVCGLFWWTLTVLTLGLLYPLAQAQLDRFKIGNTHFGDLVGRFEGSAGSLFLRGFLMWLLVVGPTIGGFILGVANIDWPELGKTIEAAADSGDIGDLVGPAFLAVQTAILATSAGVLAAVVLYPVFQAMVLRWWASGLRFSEVSLRSSLRTGQVYRIYVRFLGYSILFGLVAALVAVLGAFIIGQFMGSQGSEAKEVVATLALLVGYVAAALVYSTIYQVTVRLALWKCLMESLDISNIAALERVSAAGAPSSAIGEGLADALDVGGL